MKTKNFLYNIVETLADCLFPGRCPLCHQLMDFGKSRMLMHPECLKKLHPIGEPTCKKCGKPLTNMQQELCYDCVRTKHYYDAGHGLWLYDPLIAKSLFAFKYNNRPDYGAFYGHMLVTYYGKWIRKISPDLITCVPVTRQKERMRGYNQAAIVARWVGEEMGLRVDEHCLIRRHQTDPQKELGRLERRQNLARAFAADPKHLRGIKSVLIIDDIYTTGSTVDFCALALKRAGVKKVWFLTLSIGGRF